MRQPQRALFLGKDIAVLSHGITKEGPVPDQEIEKAIEDLKPAQGAHVQAGEVERRRSIVGAEDANEAKVQVRRG